MALKPPVEYVKSTMSPIVKFNASDVQVTSTPKAFLDLLKIISQSSSAWYGLVIFLNSKLPSSGVLLSSAKRVAYWSAKSKAESSAGGNETVSSWYDFAGLTKVPITRLYLVFFFSP